MWPIRSPLLRPRVAKRTGNAFALLSRLSCRPAGLQHMALSSTPRHTPTGKRIWNKGHFLIIYYDHTRTFHHSHIPSQQLGVQRHNHRPDPHYHKHLGKLRPSVMDVVGRPLQNRGHQCAQYQRTPQVPIPQQGVLFPWYQDVVEFDTHRFHVTKLWNEKQ